MLGTTPAFSPTNLFACCATMRLAAQLLYFDRLPPAPGLEAKALRPPV